MTFRLNVTLQWHWILQNEHYLILQYKLRDYGNQVKACITCIIHVIAAIIWWEFVVHWHSNNQNILFISELTSSSIHSVVHKCEMDLDWMKMDQGICCLIYVRFYLIIMCHSRFICTGNYQLVSLYSILDYASSPFLNNVTERDDWIVIS